eukprot:COSAG01_NODE_62251_length_285_cov_1.354839_1_plen_42_part_10
MRAAQRSESECLGHVTNHRGGKAVGVLIPRPNRLSHLVIGTS